MSSSSIPASGTRWRSSACRCPTTDGVRRAKADVIERALRGLGVEPDAGDPGGVVMVGDRVHDVRGAAQWGIPTVFVEWGYGTPDEAEGAAGRAATVERLGAILHAR